MVLDPWLWWVEMIVTVVVDATRDHGFESPVLHEWLPPATPWTYMDSFGLSSYEFTMPHGSVIETIPALSTAVFQLLHDYDRRLEWDTLLRDARLCENWTTAQLHAQSVCTGRWYLGGIELLTEYVSFNPPNVAAVKMLNRPPLFDKFAATIRHRDLSDGTSSVEYTYNFTLRPSWLQWLLHPIMAIIFRWETKKRLRSLRRYFSNHPNGITTSADKTTEQKNAPELPVGRFPRSKSLGGNRVILVVRR